MFCNVSRQSVHFRADSLKFYKLLKYSRRVFYVKKVKNLEFFRENLIFEYFPPQKVGEQNF